MVSSSGFPGVLETLGGSYAAKLGGVGANSHIGSHISTTDPCHSEKWAYVNEMTHITIPDPQKSSGEATGALPRPTPVKSDDRTVGLLVSLRLADIDRLAALLTRAEALARGRDVAADDAALAGFGEVDPLDWSVTAVRALGDKLR